MSVPKDVYCADEINELMLFATGRIYVDEKFNFNAKQVALEMIENIRKEMELLIEETTWMDDKSKEKALEKVLKKLNLILLKYLNDNY
jgi:predicted metalloendopeptidase